MRNCVNSFLLSNNTNFSTTIFMQSKEDLLTRISTAALAYSNTSSVQHILTHFFLAKNQKIKRFHFQIRIPHGIRRSPHPFSSQSDTSFARYSHLSVEVRGKSTFGDGSTIIANFYSFEKPLQSATQGAPDNLCPENSYPVYCQWLH